MAHTIIGTPNTYHWKLKDHAKPQVDKETGIVKDVVAVIMSPIDNPYNTEEFLNELKSGKDEEWVNREFWGDLSLDTGLIFPGGLKSFVNPYEHGREWHTLVKGWVWVEGLDFGGAKITNDPTAYILAKYKPNTGEIFVVDEYYQSGTTIQEDIDAITRIRARHNWTKERSKFFVADPSGRRNLKTSFGAKDSITMYKNQGLFNLRPAFNSVGANTLNNRLVATGVVRVKQMMLNGNLKISVDCGHLYKEISTYRKLALTETQRLKKSKTINTIGPDHLIDALRYIIMEMPFNNQGIDPHYKPVEVMDKIDYTKTRNAQLFKIGLDSAVSPYSNNKRRY